MPVEVTRSNFQSVVLDATQPVLVDFHAPWCQPCQVIAKDVDAVAEQYRGKAIVAKVDIAVEGNEWLANRYQVRSIPCLMMFRGGKVQSVLHGVQPVEDIAAAIDDVL